MDKLYQETVKRVVQPKFGNNQYLVGKYIKPPKMSSDEREYLRLVNDINKELADVLKEMIPKLQSVCDGRYEKDNRRYDSQADDFAAIEALFEKAFGHFYSERTLKILRGRLKFIAETNGKRSRRDWQRVVKKTLGIDLLDDYYKGSVYKELTVAWVDENVNLISTMPQATLDNMKKIVYDGWYNGYSTRSIISKIQAEYGVSKNRAKFYAVDQCGKLTAKISQEQQRDAGCKEYVWSSSGDSKVRDRHRELHGKTFSWDLPPVVDTKTGRRAHPGEDYRCRCVAIPKFDIEELNIPVKDNDWDAIDARMEVFKKQHKKKSKS